VNIIFVVAVAENGVIGRNNSMPWRIPSDLKHFRRVTMGKPVLMGRKTFESISKPLSGRTNIVVSRDLHLRVAGAVVAHDLNTGLAVARGHALRRGVDEIMVIGGGEVFLELMPMATRLEITRVHASPEGDAYFQEIDEAVWQVIARTEHAQGPSDEAAFTTLTYARR
jgi:dihydrofolate reductase